MPALNRFPLLGLWAEEAARRIGYRKDEAESLGHAYAVLYAIRAQGRPQAKADQKTRPERPAERSRRRQKLAFLGDDLEVTQEAGHVRGWVGHEQEQTPQTYQASVRKKFPSGYYDKLQRCFRQVFQSYPPSRVDSQLVYNLYDQWKKRCGVGRLVDLDQLLAWCRTQTDPHG